MSEKETNIHASTESGTQSPDLLDLLNPFPGLRPFGIEESHLFFGREGQSDEVLVKLADNRFVSVLGASGSGKSSLMYCGLIPTLYGGFMTNAGSNWRIVVTRPGGGPIDNLAEALLQKNKEYQKLGTEDRLIKKTITGTVLRSSSLGLIEAVKQLKSSESENFLILVDQFEELFRYKKIEAINSESDESSAFVNLLLEAINQYTEPIYVALTMRSDFIGECAQFPNLTQMINDSHYLIPQMTRDQKRLAIEGPVAVGGGTITGRLSQQLLNDVGDNPDHLPVLQHALMRTWQYWVENKRSGESMDLVHYNAIGTLKEALSQHADEAYDQLSRREKQICEVMFKALTERGSENQGIRRPTKLHTIAKIAGVTEDEVVNVIDKFREPGRSLLMPPHGVTLTSESVIDISHESLMRIWDRLKQWLDEESKSAEMYLKLSESAEKYQEGKSGLWQMPDLQLALNWEEENKPTLVWGQRYNLAYERTIIFLETSKKAYETEQRNKEILQKKQIKRTKVVAAILSVATLVLLTAVIFALAQSTEAKKQEQRAKDLYKEAQEAAARADKLKEDAENLAAQAVDAEAKAVIEKENAERAAREAEEAREDAEKQKQLAQDNELRAKQQQENAVKAAKRAKDAQLAADSERLKAEEAQQKAEDLRYQSIALSMAIKSKGIKDPELKALVSRQAYVFWDDYKDINEAFSGDIYSGVYYGLKALKGDSLNVMEGHEDAVRSVVFDQSGKFLYSAGSDGKILVWDLVSQKSDVLFQNDNVSRVVGISSNEKYLALGSDEDDIFLFDLDKPNAEPRKITGHGGAVFDLIFLPDNTGFISTGADQSIRISDFNSSRLLTNVKSRIKTLAIGPNGKYLAGGSENGEVWIYNLENDATDPVLLVEDAVNPVNAIVFDHSGQRVAFGQYNGNVLLWDISKLGEGVHEQITPTLTGFEGPVMDLKFSPDDKYLGAASTDKTARVWSMDKIFELPIVLDDHNDWVFTLDFHPSGDYLVTGSKDKLIRRWPVQPDGMASEICDLLTRNMSGTEWTQYVGDDIPRKETCKD